MSGDATRSGSEDVSLKRIREASDAVEKSTPELIVEKVRERWRTAGSIVVLAITTGLLYRVDGYLSIDTQVFAGITVLLLAYFLLTLRSDLKLE